MHAWSRKLNPNVFMLHPPHSRSLLHTHKSPMPVCWVGADIGMKQKKRPHSISAVTNTIFFFVSHSLLLRLTHFITIIGVIHKIVQYITIRDLSLQISYVELFMMMTIYYVCVCVCADVWVLWLLVVFSRFKSRQRWWVSTICKYVWIGTGYASVAD